MCGFGRVYVVDAWVVVGDTGVLWRAHVEQSSRTLAWFSVMHKCCKFLSDSTTTSPQLVVCVTVVTDMSSDLSGATRWLISGDISPHSVVV